ncbi:GNAT family N-acetyltransferase [Streptomyces sp. A012304]|uniref:GNAT family N-acetyltransferase n=1 Tax=Streptomyces sp. A012304 TaxID=375446 RepID=UPI002232AF66|nr:GNAT family N-acetyltransferase [Streptomyces sp. A012304]GKQ36389.1 N-acetyltransferase [Streptomyces sp. A012304]
MAGETPLRIRAATEEDLPTVVRLDAEAFPSDPYPYFVLRQMLASFPDYVFVVDDGEDLVGYVLSTPPNAARSWILSLGIAPGLRGQGLGRQLMTRILDHLRAEGVRSVSLSVEPGNDTAVALYQSLGFVPDADGPRKDYFGPGAHRLLMTLSL